jgi:hypothetical protein
MMNLRSPLIAFIVDPDGYQWAVLAPLEPK